MQKVGFRSIKKKKVKTPSSEELDSLLAHYQSGRFEDAEKLAILLAKKFPKHSFSWKVLGAILKQTGRLAEALVANQKAIVINPQDVEAFNNLGNTLQDLSRLEEAEGIYRQAIVLKPDFSEAYTGLGNTLQKIGKLEEAEVNHKQAIALKPGYPEAHNNLGVLQQELNRLEEAEVNYRKAIELKPEYAEAYYNLANTLQELIKSEDAEKNYRQAVALKPEYSAAYNNLGNTLVELGKLKEAEKNYRQAILSNPKYAQAYSNLGTTLYVNEGIDSALEYLQKADQIDPELSGNKLILSILKSRKLREEAVAGKTNLSNLSSDLEICSNPLILNRAVEVELISTLYEMNSRSLDLTGSSDARYGNGRCSPDFNMFKDDNPIIKAVADDLTNIMMEAVESNIFIYDSFFNILCSGGGTKPHRHLNKLDKDKGLKIANQKYSLVYYLSIGDQNCSDPGILKLYDPSEDILPCEGMITIIPASRKHNAVYGGEKDRVMIGVNFYRL